MKPNAEEVCSEKDRHALEADAYAAASRGVGKRHDKPAAMRAYLNGWHLTRQVEYDEGRHFLSGGKYTNS